MRPETPCRPYVAFRDNHCGKVGKKREKMRIGSWTWHSSNNSITQPATLIFPLINRWQQKAKDANLGPESPSEGVQAQQRCFQGHHKGGGRVCSGVQVTASAPSFPSPLWHGAETAWTHLVLWISNLGLSLTVMCQLNCRKPSFLSLTVL